MCFFSLVVVFSNHLFAFSKTRGLHNFYSMSYLYFGAMATSSVVIVGLIVSYATGKTIKTQ